MHMHMHCTTTTINAQFSHPRLPLKFSVEVVVAKILAGELVVERCAQRVPAGDEAGVEGALHRNARQIVGRVNERVLKRTRHFLQRDVPARYSEG